MSHSHETDNDEPLFQFDLYEVPVDTRSLHLQGPSRSTLTHTNRSSVHTISHFSLSTPDLLGHGSNQGIIQDMNEQTESGVGKGKGTSQPIFIRPQAVEAPHENFDMGLPGTSGGYVSHGSMSYSPTPPFSSSSFDLQSIPTPLDDIYQRFMIADYEDLMLPEPGENASNIASGSATGKGKARELAPMIPPLQFTPTEFGYDKAAWPSPGLITPHPGPSSYESGSGSVMESNFSANMIIQASGPSQSPPPIVRRMPSRRHSFSNISTQSMFAMSPVKTTSRTGNLARKLLQRGKAGASPSTSGTTTPGGNLIQDDLLVGQGSCLMPWRSIQTKDSPPVPFLNLEAKLHQQALPVYNGRELKGKARSYSSPLPFSALDIIPSAPTDVFKPIVLAPRKFFDEMLPRELRLSVLSSLIDLHEAEHARIMPTDDWSVTRASSTRNRWVGREKGARELVKFSRVSKSWQALVLDGQIWRNMDLRAFPRIPSSLLTRLAKFAGPFVQTIDVSGHTTLLPSTLTGIVHNLCLNPSPNVTSPCTQLTSINFQGCAALTTRSLHELILCSPTLQTVCLKGLTAVTNTTCDVLGEVCPHLTSLNISRCLHVDGWGIRSLITSALVHGPHLMLKELMLSGLKRVNDRTLAALGKSAPLLEVLDLSYVHDLHNSALEAFVSCTDEENVHGETVLLTPREAGRDPSDWTRYRRRVTRLRHLSLSSCDLLTDIACSNLAHTMPRLELLELGGIGAELHDGGLVRLLNSTPLIRKLDLEDASDITDTLLATLTPSAEEPTGRSRVPEPPQTGHALEHLVVSYAANVTDQAFLSLIKNCPRLTVLEADNTRISGNVLREFVHLSRKRQAVDPTVVAIDCRGVGENLVKELAHATRPRQGRRAYEARKLGYVDARDGSEDLKVGRDECDEKRVVLKSFYSWQTVDAVQAAREKRRKTRRVANVSNGSTSDFDDATFFASGGRARWWTPSARRSSGTSSPEARLDQTNNDQCIIM